MKDSITISSGSLRASVLTPDSPIYNRVRFAHTGFVNALEYAGVSFAEPEQAVEGRATSGGIGLCSQYIFPDSEAEAKAGEEYLRLGIGVAQKQDHQIMHLEDVPYSQLETSVECGEDFVRFVTASPSVNGYAYKEERLVRVQGNALTIETIFENTGDKTINALEYNHNFVSIASKPIGNLYKMLLPCVEDTAKSIAEAERAPGLIAIDGGVTWAKEPQIPFFHAFQNTKPGAEYAWKLIHAETSASIMEITDFVSVRATVWGVEHCACAEIFKEIKLDPGEKDAWTRRFVVTA